MNKLAYWHTLVQGNNHSETTEYLTELATETLNALMVHHSWLNENGLDIALQVDEQNSYEVMGIFIEKDTMGLIANIADPRTRTVFPVPVQNVTQFSVYPMQPQQ